MTHFPASSSYASFAALYARNVFLIAAFSAVFAFVLTTQRERVKKLVNALENRAVFVLALFIAGYAALFSVLCVMRHLTFHSHGADLGIYTQVTYNTASGNFMDSSLDGVNYLGKHVILSTLLLVPFYELFPSPVMVLILQAFLLALGALALYGLAVHVSQRKIFGLLAALLYLLSTPLHYITLYDFHPDILATASFLFAFYFLTVRRKLPYYIFLAVAVFSKEQMSLIGFMFGLYQIFGLRQRKEGALVCAASALWFYLCIFVIVPHFLQKPYFFFEAYDYLGKSFGERVHTLFFRPLFVLRHVLTPVKMAYVFLLLIPLAFLPVLRPAILVLALPTLAINLLGSEEHIHYHSLFFQYNASVLPFLYIALVYALNGLRVKKPSLFMPVCACVLFLHVFFSYYFGPAPWSKTFWNPDYKVAQFRTLDYSYKSYVPAENAAALREGISHIPAGASVSAQSDIVPHLVNRRGLYFFPSFIEKADYVIIDMKGNIWPLTEKSAHEAGVLKLRNDRRFSMIFSKDGVMVFKRR